MAEGDTCYHMEPYNRKIMFLPILVTVLLSLQNTWPKATSGEQVYPGSKFKSTVHHGGEVKPVEAAAHIVCITKAESGEPLQSTQLTFSTSYSQGAPVQGMVLPPMTHFLQ